MIFIAGDYATWQAAAARCVGYDSVSIMSQVLDATQLVKRWWRRPSETQLHLMRLSTRGKSLRGLCEPLLKVAVS
jgi:hypothetical protein